MENNCHLFWQSYWASAKKRPPQVDAASTYLFVAGVFKMKAKFNSDAIYPGCISHMNYLMDDVVLCLS